MGERSAKLCENCSRSYWAYGPRLPILICNKKESSEGKHFVVEPMACCSNYKAGRKDGGGRRHTSAENKGAKFIPLIRGGFAIVDADDYEKLAKYTWYCEHNSNTSYAVRRKNRKRIYMHRQILNAPKGKVVDHKDSNGLNNRKSNVRLCTKTQNMRNRRPWLRCSSKYKGVSLDECGNKWRARITFNRKKIHIGNFDDEIEAARAYDRKAKELFGEFAYLNFPESATAEPDN
jgi:hypothetical protein